MAANPVDRDGVFRAKPTQCGVDKGDNGAISFRAVYKILEWYDPEGKQWYPWETYNQEILGYYLLTSNAGKIMDGRVRNLAEAFDWDGQLESLERPEMDTCQIVLREETYKGKTARRLQWINPADAEPRTGELKRMDINDVRALDAQWSSQFRAIAGSVKAAAKPFVPPAAAPKTPPPPPAR